MAIPAAKPAVASLAYSGSPGGSICLMPVLIPIKAPRFTPTSKTAGASPRYKDALADERDSRDRTVTITLVPERCMLVLTVSIGNNAARTMQPAAAPAMKFWRDDS